MGRHKTTRGQVRAALAAVDDLVPVPWDVELLVERLARRRGRPIRLQSARFPPGRVSGLWIPMEHEDVILYDRAANSPTLKEQIIGHELGHMLMNHHHLDEFDGAAALTGELLTSAISPGLVQRFLARTVYDDQLEAAAEEFGTRLLRAGRKRRRGAQDADPLGRLTDSL